MKVFLSTWSLHRLFFAQAIGIRSMPGLGRNLGFDGVELEDIWFSSTSPAELRRLRDEEGKHRTRVSIAISNDFTVGSRRDFRTQINHVKQFLRIAKVFRRDVVRILMGRERSSPEALLQVREGLRHALNTAEELGLKLAIENHDRLSRNPNTMLEVLDEFPSSRLGVCLDFGNLGASTRYQFIRRLAPRAFLVHAKSYRFRPNGEEANISFGRCFSILRKAGYRGPVVVEYDGPGDQLLGTLKTLALVRKHSATR